MLDDALFDEEFDKPISKFIILPFAIVLFLIIFMIFQEAFKHMLATLIACLSVAYAWYLLVVIDWNNLFSKSIPSRIDAETLIGENKTVAVNLLKMNGFTNIVAKPFEDLRGTDLDKENQVFKVLVQKQGPLTKDNLYKPSDKIFLYYHTPLKVYPPDTGRSCIGKDYKSVANAFRRAGFVNVNTQYTGQMDYNQPLKPPTVECVMIDGDQKFKTETGYRPNAEVKIYYSHLH